MVCRCGVAPILLFARCWCRHALLPVWPVAVVAPLQALPWLRPAGPRNALTLRSLVPISAELWSLASRLGVAGVQKQPRSSDGSQGHAREALPLRNVQHALQPLSNGGLGFSLSQLRVPSQPPVCCPFPSPSLPTLTANRLS